ncbi:putative tetratricopeptide-like helical domain superfamily [Helianthus annuus]|nr:putative tetratricopeptide-like helical domain superfamily [Helianthus annuus]
MTSISYYVLMLSSNIRPANLTFPFVLKSTAALQEGWLGMEIHTQILKLGLLCDRLVLLHLVDMYAKVGLLECACQWGDDATSTLLWNVLINGYCKVGKWGKAVAEYASEKLLEVEPKHPGGYVFLSNVYAGAGKWEDVERVRTKMKNKGVAKDPGWSYMVKSLVS